MAKSRETYSKKENEKKKHKKKQDKVYKKEQRKAGKEEGKSFEDMLAYVDEDGNLTSTPPDPTKKKKIISSEEIEIGVPRREKEDPTRKGKISYFDDTKGFGFIIDQQSEERIFVHVNALEDLVKMNDKVTFEIEKGPKGPMAVNVRLLK